MSQTYSGSLTTPFDYTWIQDSETIATHAKTRKFTKSTRQFENTSRAGRKTYETITADGKISSTQVGTYSPTNFSYNGYGQLVNVSQGARGVTYTYNADGWLNTATNSLSEQTSYTYDDAGRVLTTTLPDSRVITYTYDDNGNVTSITPPSKPAHNFTFTLAELVDIYAAPQMGSPLEDFETQYSYNDDKQMTGVLRADGQVIAYNYDATKGRLNSVSIPGRTLTYAYSVTHGLLSSITTNNDTTTISYTYNKDLLSQERTNFNTLDVDVDYTYNLHLLPSNITVTAGTYSSSIDYDYDLDGMMTQAGSLYLTNSPVSGAVNTLTIDDVRERRVYDPTYGTYQGGNVLKISTSGLLYGNTLTRDAVGRVTRKSETIGGTTTQYDYTYDSAGRLIDVDVNSSAYSDYTYDSNSNRTSGAVGGTSFSATVDDQDRLLTYNTLSFTYNKASERTSKYDSSTSQTTSYSYDAFGNLKMVTLPASTISYVLDGLGRRMARKNGSTVLVRFAYDDQRRLVLARAANGIATRFIYASKSHVPEYMTRSGVSYRIVTDYLGSVRLVVRSSDATIMQRIDYNEFGKVINDTSPGFQPFGYAGGIYDNDTKLLNFQFREYDPEVGRWMQKDPILFRGGDANLYGYVLNDPVNLVDPNGLEANCMEDNCTDGASTRSGGGGTGSSSSSGSGYSSGTTSTSGSTGVIYVSPNGTAVVAPPGSVVTTSVNGRGLNVKLPGSSHPNGNMTRIMDPTSAYPKGYVRTTDATGRYLDVNGNLVNGKYDPAGHICPK